MAGHNTQWKFFNKNSDIQVSYRSLPHFDMSETTTFVTFRLIDSMPKNVVTKWTKEIDEWLKLKGLEGRNPQEIFNDTLVDESIKKELRRFRKIRWHGHLDDCHGKCLLKQEPIRNIVRDSLLFFDAKRYDIDRFVLMPNHVHLLVQIRAGYELRKVFRDLLRYSARQINIYLNRKGAIWQSEPFDHIVRNQRQFEYLREYIDNNPVKAKLREGEFLLWHTD